MNDFAEKYTSENNKLSEHKNPELIDYTKIKNDKLIIDRASELESLNYLLDLIHKGADIVELKNDILEIINDIEN